MDIFARITCITISCLLKNDNSNVELYKKYMETRYSYTVCVTDLTTIQILYDLGEKVLSEIGYKDAPHLILPV